MKNIKILLIISVIACSVNLFSQTCDPLIAAYSFVATNGNDDCITDEFVELEVDWGMGGDFGDCTAPEGSFQIQINLPAAGPYGVNSASDVITPSSFSWALSGTSLIGTNNVVINTFDEGTIVVKIYGLSTNGCALVPSNAQVVVLASALGGSPGAYGDDTNNNGSDLPASIGVDQVTPVKFSRFGSDSNDCSMTELFWQTASETNNEGFFIERSLDGKKYEEAGYVAGNGSTSKVNNYTFTDEYFIDQSFDRLYYRLRQVDFDGGIDYSDIIAVSRECASGIVGYRITPNPARDYITIQLEKPAMDSHSGVIVNNVGSSVINLNIANSKKVDISALHPGVYSVKLNIEGETLTKRFIVVK